MQGFAGSGRLGAGRAGVGEVGVKGPKRDPCRHEPRGIDSIRHSILFTPGYYMILTACGPTAGADVASDFRLEIVRSSLFVLDSHVYTYYLAH